MRLYDMCGQCKCLRPNVEGALELLSSSSDSTEVLTKGLGWDEPWPELDEHLTALFTGVHTKLDLIQGGGFVLAGCFLQEARALGQKETQAVLSEDQDSFLAAVVARAQRTCEARAFDTATLHEVLDAFKPDLSWIRCALARPLVRGNSPFWREKPKENLSPADSASCAWFVTQLVDMEDPMISYLGVEPVLKVPFRHVADVSYAILEVMDHLWMQLKGPRPARHNFDCLGAWMKCAKVLASPSVRNLEVLTSAANKGILACVADVISTPPAIYGAPDSTITDVLVALCPLVHILASCTVLSPERFVCTQSLWGTQCLAAFTALQAVIVTFAFSEGADTDEHIVEAGTPFLAADALCCLVKGAAAAGTSAAYCTSAGAQLPMSCLLHLRKVAKLALRVSDVAIRGALFHFTTHLTELALHLLDLAVGLEEPHLAWSPGLVRSLAVECNKRGYQFLYSPLLQRFRAAFYTAIGEKVPTFSLTCGSCVPVLWRVQTIKVYLMLTAAAGKPPMAHSQGTLYALFFTGTLLDVPPVREAACRLFAAENGPQIVLDVLCSKARPSARYAALRALILYYGCCKTDEGLDAANLARRQEIRQLVATPLAKKCMWSLFEEAEKDKIAGVESWDIVKLDGDGCFGNLTFAYKHLFAGK